jgi:hypothetical protein
MKLSAREMRRRIIRKMARRSCWGGKHTSFDNLKKGFPPHLKGDVEDEAKRLIKEGIIIAKTTGYGLEVSLNPRRKKEIEEILRGL